MVHGVRKIVILTAALCLVAPAGSAFAATGGYGPTSPTGPASTPGGYTSVIAVKTISAAGGSLNTPVAGSTLTITAPPGALTPGDQIQVTAPSLRGVQTALPHTGFTGYRAVAGVGIGVRSASGARVTTTFAKPITVKLTGSALGVPGEKVLEFTGPSSVAVVPSSVGAHSISFSVTHDPNLTVVNPPATPGAATASGASNTSVPGATTQDTGLPFTGLRDLAYLLGGLGLVAFGFAVKRRWLVRAAH